MKKEIFEYYPNDNIKHRINFFPNGNKWYEQFYDQQGKDHRKQGLPDYQKWYGNGITCHKTYNVHGNRHNIHNPYIIGFLKTGRILYKSYDLNNHKYSKLGWQNKIKNI